MIEVHEIKNTITLSGWDIKIQYLQYTHLVNCIMRMY